MSSAAASCRLSLCAGGCERASQALDWAWDDIDDSSEGRSDRCNDDSDTSLLSGVCYYACSNLVLCYCPALYRVTASLRGHSAPVRCVRALSSTSVLSGSLDGTVREWTVDAPTGRYDCVSTLSGHSSGVTALDACCVANWASPTSAPLRVLAAASGSGVHVWLSSAAGHWRVGQLIPLPPQRRAMCVSLCVLYVRTGAIVHLTVGGVDCRVALLLCHIDTALLADAVTFALPPADPQLPPLSTPPPSPSPSSSSCPLSFVAAVSLSGHTDWVRSLSATVLNEQHEPHEQRPPQAQPAADVQFVSGASVLLASAAQDKTVRLWKVQWTELSGTAEGEAGAEAATRKAAAAARGLAVSSLGSRGYVVHMCGLRGLLLFDSLLSGHDDWVMAVQLTQQKPLPGGPSSPPLSIAVDGADMSPSTGRPSWCVARQSVAAVPSSAVRLLSCSADNSAIVWSPAASASASSIWQISARLGELSSGGTHGLYGARWGSGHRAVIAHGSASTVQHSTHAALLPSSLDEPH